MHKKLGIITILTLVMDLTVILLTDLHCIEREVLLPLFSCCVLSGISLSFLIRFTATVTRITLAGTRASNSKLRLKAAGDMVRKFIYFADDAELKE